MQKLNTVYGKGIEQYPNSDALSARDIQNLDYDFGQRAWTNKFGWISYWSNPQTSTASVYSIFHWQPRGKLDRTVFEFNAGDGTLTLAYLAPYEAAGYLPIEERRHIPSVQEVGTTYAPFGEMLIYANGYNAMRKWYGWAPQTTTVFGFPVRPSPPEVIPTEDGGFFGSKNAPDDYDWDGFSGIDENFTKIVVATNSQMGLGDPAANSVNAYSYKVTFITDTQSESPMSPSSAIISWTNGNTEAYDNNNSFADYPGRYCIQLTNIPTGPLGTIKRRLYRTKNLQGLTGTAEEQTYYFLDDIPNNVEVAYTDVIPDANLGSVGPSELDSGIIPSNIKFCATFGNRVVIGGGNSYPTRVFFSAPYKPEQFPVQNFIELGIRTGGAITGFVSYNNLLLVFRERGIDALVPTQDPNAPFYATPIFETMGTLASKTAQVVAGSGVLFVASDGIYQFTGNLAGGSQPALVKISSSISDIWDRVSVSSLAKACAVYDGLEQTYTLSVPVDGNSYNSLVLKYNILLGAWSTSTGIPMSCATISSEGAVLFGTNTEDIGGEAPTSVGVICDSNWSGYQIVDEAYESKPKDSASWTSAWLDFGDPDSTKAIKSVSIECYSTGGNLLLEAGKDWEYTFPYSIPSEMKQADGNPQTQWDIGEWGSSTWENRRLSKVRFDIELPDVRFFRFRISNMEPAQVKIIGYSVYFEVAGEQMAWSSAFDYFGAPTSNQKVNPSKLPL